LSITVSYDYYTDCLTERGKEQAKATTKRLKEEKIDQIYPSLLGRDRETVSFLVSVMSKLTHFCYFMPEIQWHAKNE